MLVKGSLSYNIIGFIWFAKYKPQNKLNRTVLLKSGPTWSESNTIYLRFSICFGSVNDFLLVVRFWTPLIYIIYILNLKQHIISQYIISHILYLCHITIILMWYLPKFIFIFQMSKHILFFCWGHVNINRIILVTN